VQKRKSYFFPNLKVKLDKLIHETVFLDKEFKENGLNYTDIEKDQK
jgi:hypothetical protein